MEATVEREVMVVVAVLEEEEGVLTVPLQELVQQEELEALEGGAEAAEVLGVLQIQEAVIMAVMVQQEVMAEVEGVAVAAVVAVAVPLVALD